MDQFDVIPWKTFPTFTEHVKIAQVNDIVHKQQCFFSYDTPFSPLGLFVNLFSFHCYGYRFVKLYFKTTGLRLYLHIKRNTLNQSNIPNEDNISQSSKPTKLGIGIDGGFLLQQDKVLPSEQLSLVILPEFIFIPISTELPSIIYDSLMSIIDKEDDHYIDQFQSWEQKLFISKHSESLIQLDAIHQIHPSGWRCAKCDLTSNLWLNLTDGSILCGRRQFDGSGGNDHALEHFKITKYPLAVKLGTITPTGGDVFSYDEDEMVIDSNLSLHLEHFGINIASMHKTERTMSELQIDLNIQIGEASIIQESESTLKPLEGSGLTGLNNLGNSCYLNSVFQVIFSLPHFHEFYYKQTDYDSLFDSSDNLFNINFQLKKFAQGLYNINLSIDSDIKKFLTDQIFTNVVVGNQSFPNFSLKEIQPTVISPIHLRMAIGKGHREFSSTRQQDAQEYLLHVLNMIDRCLLSSNYNPCDAFRFTVEDRVECLQTNQVQYYDHTESVLSLSIPIDSIESLVKMQEDGLSVDEFKDCFDITSKQNIFHVTIEECLKNFQIPHIVSDFLSPLTNKLGKASKSSKIKTFPDYLFIHFAKFYIGADWIPRKLDVEILGTQENLNIDFLRALERPKEQSFVHNLEQLNKLIELGCDEVLSKRALQICNNDFDDALAWIFNPDLQKDNVENLDGPKEVLVQSIMDFGFDRAQSIFALKKTNNNLERSVDYLFSHIDELSTLLNSDSTRQKKSLTDGIGKYTLYSIISHIGKSSMSGHYVAHILKDDNWVLFNDEKVVESKNPPFKLGYIYLYKRANL